VTNGNFNVPTFNVHTSENWMTRTAKPRGNRDTFHHGDMPDALVAAASRLIAERRSAAISLREVAEAVGVSHAAVYRHFPAKLDLMAEIATRGFRRLAKALKVSVVMAPEGTMDGPASLAAMGRAYVAFGLDNPGAYRAMFLSELCDDAAAHPALAEASLAAFTLLVEVIAAGQRAGSLRQDCRADEIASSVWAAEHGYTVLLIENQIRDSERGHSDAPPGSLEALLAILIAGLARLPD
jgi:AcrR family transcriptional regulator